MRTLSLKRFFTLLLLFVVLACLLFASSTYYLVTAEWVSGQVKQATGYDIRFEQFESNWLTDSRLSLVGVSLYQQQQPLVRIKRVDIQVEILDFLQQEVDIGSINLDGVEIKLKLPINHFATESQGATDTAFEALAWQRLHIDSFTVTNINVSIENEHQQLSLKGMSVELNDLLVIDNKQLQTLPAALNANTQIKSLQLKNEEQQAQLENLQLSVAGDLVQRTGRLTIGVDKIEVTPEQQAVVVLRHTQLALSIQQERLNLENLSMNAFSGDLKMQADALLEIDFLPKPELKVKQVTLQSLLVKDMQLTIPNWQGSEEKNSEQVQSKDMLPIEALLVKNIQLQNINVTSANLDLPLTATGLQLQLLGLQLVENYQWLDLLQPKQQGASFSIMFDSLRWKESLIEGFSTQGRLGEDDQGLIFLQEKLVNP